jgi:pyridoxamine 5'-phosphate oxidase-like protein
MASWDEVEAAAPALAGAVRACFAVRKHCTMATLRRDGAPRISGTEVEFSGGELWLGMMPGSLKALDLRRDPRVALHSATVDPPGDDPSGWPGEAKLAGRAVEVSDAGRTDQPHRFRIDIGEVVLTRIGQPADHLLIESWHPDRGYTRRQRA